MKKSCYFFIVLMSSYVFLEASGEGGISYINYFNAVKRLDLKKVEECVDTNKIDINMTDGDQCTALHHLALLKGKKNTKLAKKLIAFFLDMGIDTRKTDEVGNNAVFYATYCKNISIIKQITKHEIKKKYPMLSLNVQDKKGITSVLLAASLLEPKNFFELIKWGGDIAAKTKNGWTLVHAALKRKHYDFAAQLIRSGAPFLEKTKQGEFPIDLLESENERNNFIKALFGYSSTLKPSTLKKARSYYMLLLKGDNRMPQEIGFDKALYKECKKEVARLKPAQKSQGL